MWLKVIMFSCNLCIYESTIRRNVRLTVDIFKQEFLDIYVVKINTSSRDTENTNEFNFGPHPWNTVVISHVDKIWTKQMRH